MKKDFFLTRYALIIKKLEAAPANYSQISDYLLNTHEFQDAGVTSYSVRTLQRDILEISRLFNLSIHNKKKGDNRYYIESRPVMEVDEYNQKLLESFQISNVMNMHPDFSEFIFFESRKPTGLEYFYDLFFAIRNKRIITFDYIVYKTKERTSRKVHPLALKESKNRWYLIAVDTNDKKLKSFGLDRIQYLEVSKGRFRERYQYQFKEHFRHSFGVMSPTGVSPEKVVLKCTKQQGEYIRSFPIHQSQKSVKETPEESFFEFFLHPTYDFVQEILSYGKEVTVLEPRSLVDEIYRTLTASVENYRDLNNTGPGSHEE
ncbi:helix-turn-helix transcriptional regulator [Chryseobacterium sp.]|uniref:helix-turn-helix transcriptional regulator n=1 Tax=Chryseobacterium sp. TaxID=1871047 RepID=UPI0011CB5DE4|nr:WYL domain-containing protein [Chryseobacterium sp.]TXF79498.1 WYL domain-containing protein [Chryseobacterium sp.]